MNVKELTDEQLAELITTFKNATVPTKTRRIVRENHKKETGSFVDPLAGL